MHSTAPGRYDYPTLAHVWTPPLAPKLNRPTQWAACRAAQEALCPSHSHHVVQANG